MNTQPTSSLPPPTRKAIYGLSQRVVRLAREVDKLPPGRYMIEIVKDDLHAAEWRLEIVRVDVVQKMSLSKYIPE
jgi:hypothetical protein